MTYIQALLEKLKLKWKSDHLSHKVIKVEPWDSHTHNNKKTTDMKAKVDEIEAKIFELEDTIQKLKIGRKV